MPEPSESRVGVYIDFDNVVISRYDQLWGRGDFMRDRARQADTEALRATLEQAKVDIGAILDYSQLVRHDRGQSRLCRLVGSGQRELPAATDQQGRGSRPAVPGDLRRQERGRHPSGRGCRRRALPPARPDARGDRRGRLGLHRAGAERQAPRPHGHRHRGRRRDQSRADGGLRRVHRLRRAAGRDAVREARAGRGAGELGVDPERKPAKAATPPADSEPDAHLTQDAATDLLVRALQIVENRGDDDWAGNSQVKNQTGNPPRPREARRPPHPGRRDRPARARLADRREPRRRRLGGQLAGQESDAAHGLVVQREVAGLQVVHRLRRLALERRRGQRGRADEPAAAAVARARS